MGYHIYFFSGLGSSLIPALSLGTRTLEAMTDALGVDATHMVWHRWPEAALHITLRYTKGDRVILVGHSNGVLACANIANKLYREGVPVDYIGAIDPTAAAFPTIKANTLAVEEFWASSGWPAFTRRLTHKRRGAIVVDSSWGGKHSLTHLPRTTHIASASHPLVKSKIMRSIEAYLKDG